MKRGMEGLCPAAAQQGLVIRIRNNTSCIAQSKVQSYTKALSEHRKHDELFSHLNLLDIPFTSGTIILKLFASYH